VPRYAVRKFTWKMYPATFVPANEVADMIMLAGF